MQYFKNFLFLVPIFFITSCNFNQVVMNQDLKNNYILTLDDSIPQKLEEKILNLFGKNNDGTKTNRVEIFVNEFQFNDYTIYSGSAFRSLETEISATLVLKILKQKKIQKKEIKIMKRYKSNELNPFADEGMIKTIKDNIYSEILNEIIIEVSIFEM